MKHAVLRPAGRRRRLMASGTAAALIWLGAAGAATAASASPVRDHDEGGFNTPGDILIAACRKQSRIRSAAHQAQTLPLVIGLLNEPAGAYRTCDGSEPRWWRVRYSSRCPCVADKPQASLHVSVQYSEEEQG